MSISPSRLVYVEACPKFKPTPFTNNAAEDGIQLHALMEQLVAVPLEQWDEHIDSLKDEPESVKDVLRRATQVIAPFATMAPQTFPDVSLVYGSGVSVLTPGMYPELRIETSRGRFGYIDLLINMGHGNFVIIDYKFVRAASDFELQLAAYACCLAKHLGGDNVSSIRSIIVAPYVPEDQADSLRWSYSKEELAEYESLIKDIEEKADSPNYDGVPGTHCEHCKFNGRCRYQATHVSSHTDMSSLATAPTLGDLLKPVTSAQRALRRDFVRCAEAMIEAIKADDSVFFLENPDITLPGYTVTLMPGRSTLDKDRAPEINREILSHFGGAIGASDLLDVSLPDVARLASFVAFKTGIDEKEAKKKLTTLLDGFSKRGASYPVLRKSSSKKRVQKSLQANN